MIKKLLALSLCLSLATIIYAQKNPAFIFTDPSDGHSTGSINGTTDVLDMDGGFKEGGSDTLSNAISGNAATATALAADPAACSVGSYMHDISANGTVVCKTITDAEVPNSITINVAAAANAVNGTPTKCSAGSFTSGINSSFAAQDCTDVLTEAELNSLAALNTQIGSGLVTGAHTTALAHSAITAVGASDHHVKTTALAHSAITAVGASDHHVKTTALAHSAITAVGASDHHTATVNTDAGTKCAAGQYLDGDNTCKTAASASGSVYVTAFPIGDQADVGFQCVVLSDGGVTCSGNVGLGVSGRGHTNTALVPQRVSLPSAVDSIVSSGYQTFALLTNGQVYGWGYGIHGQMGDGAILSNLYPERVGTLTGVVKLSVGGSAGHGGNHACAVTSGGALYCWGYNGYGQLGTGNTTNQSSPYQVVASGVADVECGGGLYGTTHIIYTDGTMKAMGSDIYGNLGDSQTTTSVLSPAVVYTTGDVAVSDAVKVWSNGGYASSAHHTCYLDTGGGLWCAGYNGYGQLGDNTLVAKDVFTQVTGLTSGVQNVDIIDGNVSTTMVILTDGRVGGFGYNAYGNLGVGDTNNRSTFSYTNGGIIFSTMTMSGGDDASGLATACGVEKTTTDVYCWGYNGNYQVGDNTTTNRYEPTKVNNLSGIVRLHPSGTSSSSAFSALDSSGKVWSWGINGSDLLGCGVSIANIGAPCLMRVQ